MHMAVDADDLLDMGGNRSQIVRYHDDGHFVVELFEQRVKLLLEPVVDEIGRFVQNQQFRIGNQSSPEQGPLQLSARQGADRPSGDRFDSADTKQIFGFFPVGGSVSAEQFLACLKARKNDLAHRNGERLIQIRNLRHISDTAVAAALDLFRVNDFPRVWNRLENRLDQRGLTAAVRSDNPEKVLRMNIQIDVTQRLARPVSYRYVIEFDQFGHGLSNGL